MTGSEEVGHCDCPHAINVADVWAGNTSRPLALSDHPRRESRTQMLFPSMKWVGGNGDVAGGERAPLGVPVICIKESWHHLRAVVAVVLEWPHVSIWRA